MEKTTIGYNAGAIWDKLRETGRITIAELARKLNMAADETAIAAGWLAREGKVYIERINGLLHIGESDATPQEDKRQTPAYSPYHAIMMLKRFLFIHFKTIY